MRGQSGADVALQIVALIVITASWETSGGGAVVPGWAVTLVVTLAARVIEDVSGRRQGRRLAKEVSSG